MNWPTEVREIARVTGTLWVRDSAQVLRTTTRRIRLLAGAAGICTVLFGLALAVMSTSNDLADLPEELRSTVVRTAIAAAVLMVTAVCVVLAAMSPARTSLQNLLDLLPTRRSTARIGQLIPQMLVTSVMGGSLSCLTAAVMAQFVDGAWGVLRVVSIAILTVVIAQSCAMGTVLLLSALATRVLRCPLMYANSGAAVCALAGAVSLWWYELNSVPAISVSGPRRLLLPDALTSLFFGGVDWLTVPVVLGWSVAGVAAAVAGSLIGGQARADIRVPVLTRVPMPRRSFIARAWWQFLTAVRSPQTWIAGIAMWAMVALVVVLRDPLSELGLGQQLASTVPVAPFLMSLFAVGRTLPTAWLPEHLTARRTAMTASTIAAYTLLASVLSVPGCLVLLSCGLLTPDDLRSVGARALLALAAGLIGGALVPIGEEQPLSVPLAGCLTVVLSVGSNLAADAVQDAIRAPDATAHLCAALALLASWVAAMRRYRPPLRRA
jgi:hypothetical protein